MADTKETIAAKPAAPTDAVKDEKPTEPRELDLAFAMDCTGSMGSYIKSAQRSIRNIVEEIVSKESADVRLALVEYRDHPPQDRSFITRPHDFTQSVRDMKTWLDASSADGGGDGPEAVADALHDVLKLSWRENSTKICVFIADAPPHGLGRPGDGFPNGCPSGLDPMEIGNGLAEKGVTIYMVGCEPAILSYKEFFTGLAHLTGGQYVPLTHADLLAKVIIGGAQEELSLQHLMEEVNQEVMQEAAGSGEIDEDEVATRLHAKLRMKGVRTKQVYMNACELPEASDYARDLSSCKDLASVRKKEQERKPESPPRSRSFFSRKKKSAAALTSAPPAAFSMMGGSAPPPPPPAPELDDYEVAEEFINCQQARRMVKKTVAKNKLATKSARE